ncbi:MAG: S8 family serine peptidase [Bacteroidetes bacterium]|jgi:subtilisin family serine protease|nr:S8 family serine peptidase [Bacteroidota bacterium]
MKLKIHIIIAMLACINIYCQDDAWDIVENISSNVKISVAINDDGFDTDHEDLIDNIVYVEPYSDNDARHGTSVAGLVGMVNNNNTGFCSVAGSNISMYLYRFGDPDDIREAADSNVRIINMSWGFCSHSSVYESAFDYATSRGVILVNSGGNCNCPRSSPNCTTIKYPSGYSDVIGVAALTSDDIKRSNSSYGNWIDLCAPGDGLTTTIADFSTTHS